MLRLLVVLLAGILIGAAVSWLAMPSPGPQLPSTADVVRDIVVVEKMSAIEAEQHREASYRELSTVQEIYELPTEFARREALYALAGRSDAEAVQALIFDANRISDEIDRNAALNVLFFRLTELDAPSALALARTEYFRGVKAIERSVWIAWGRNDLDGALAMAAGLSGNRRSFAAQSLYRAFGFMGNETIERIEDELGVSPDQSTRGQFLYAMADRSLAEAISYINDLRPLSDQQTMTWWLAYYVAFDDPEAALQYAELFENQSLRETFRGQVQRYAAQNDPKAALARIVAEGGNLRRNGGFHSALTALAAADLDAALEFYANLSATDDRSFAAEILASAMAMEDPDKALQWARDNATNETTRQQLELTILNVLAQSDPERAIVEAQNIGGPRGAELVSSVVAMVAQSDPSTAVKYLDLINDRQQRRQAQSQLATAWMRADAEAAVNWILRQDEETAAALLNESIWPVVHRDTSMAIRLLPRLDDVTRSAVRQQIAMTLAGNSPAEAQAFIRQFATEADYPQLQASIVAGVAQNDPAAARQLADQIVDPVARDTAYFSLVAQQAELGPRDAAALANQIVDEEQRSMAIGYVAEAWAESDPAAATRWAQGLPSGPSRGQAVISLAGRWQDPGPEHIALVDSIADEQQRNRARQMMVLGVANRSPERARRLLDTLDLPAGERRQMERWLTDMRTRGRVVYD